MANIGKGFANRFKTDGNRFAKSLQDEEHFQKEQLEILKAEKERYSRKTVIDGLKSSEVDSKEPLTDLCKEIRFKCVHST